MSKFLRSSNLAFMMRHTGYRLEGTQFALSYFNSW